MDRCDRFGEDLTAFVDDELSTERAEEVREHLNGCADCRAVEAQLRAVVGLVAGLPRERAPEGLSLAVVEVLRASTAEGAVPAGSMPGGRLLLFPALRQVVSMAAAVLIVVAGWQFVSGGYSGMNAPRESAHEEVADRQPMKSVAEGGHGLAAPESAARSGSTFRGQKGGSWDGTAATEVGELLHLGESQTLLAGAVQERARRGDVGLQAQDFLEVSGAKALKGRPDLGLGPAKEKESEARLAGGGILGWTYWATNVEGARRRVTNLLTDLDIPVLAGRDKADVSQGYIDAGDDALGEIVLEVPADQVYRIQALVSALYGGSLEVESVDLAPASRRLEQAGDAGALGYDRGRRESLAGGENGGFGARPGDHSEIGKDMDGLGPEESGKRVTAEEPRAPRPHGAGPDDWEEEEVTELRRRLAEATRASREDLRGGQGDQEFADAFEGKEEDSPAPAGGGAPPAAPFARDSEAGRVAPPSEGESDATVGRALKQLPAPTSDEKKSRQVAVVRIRLRFRGTADDATPDATPARLERTPGTEDK